jgi:hypothetical protein
MVSGILGPSPEEAEWELQGLETGGIQSWKGEGSLLGVNSCKVQTLLFTTSSQVDMRAKKEMCLTSVDMGPY